MLIATMLLASAVSSVSLADEIMVSAAISLKDALTALATKFEKGQSGAKIVFNFGASGQLRAQIENGAPADVFVSASISDVDTLAKRVTFESSPPAILAKNSLVLIRNRTKAPGLRGLDGLSHKGIRRIAIGNPATVPAGRYARETLEFRGLAKSIASKLVLTENVRQVLDFVARGEVDAGFVYATDALVERDVRIVERVPAGQHQPIQYPAVVLSAGKNRAGAKRFVEFLTSPDARRVLKKFGFE